MNSKLFQLLRTFDKKSLFAFYKWAQIPYFNNNTIIVSYIKAYIPIASKNTINTKDIEKIYKAIYPKNQFNLNHFKQIQTAVYQCVLQFVAQIQLHKDAAKKRELGQVYLYENEPKLYAKEWKHLRSKFVVKNEAQYESSFRELDLYNRFTVDEIRKKGRKLNFDSKEVLQELSAFFIISYLRYACQVVNLKNLKTYEEELPWIEQVLVQAKRCKDDYVIQIYLTTYQLVSNPEEQGFYLLKDLLEKFAIHLEKPDAFEVYIYAQNYCIRQFNGGNANYLNELFDLYKETLDKEIILNQGELSPWDYKNIVFVGLKLKAFNWTAQFVEEYKAYLPSAECENAYTYNKARIHFAKKEYQEVLHLLSAVEYTDIFYQLDAKSTLLKTYYEMDEMDSMDSLIESFKILILRSKQLSSSYKTLYKNLASFTKRISRTLPQDKDRINKLYKQVSNKPCADKNWLKEKLTELNGSQL